MEQPSVRDVMATRVVAVGATTPFKEVAALLVGHRLTALPVVRDDGRLLGMLSEADLLPHPEGRPSRFARAWRALRGPGRRTVNPVVAAGLATVPARTIGPDADLAEAARVFREHGLRRMPVVDDAGRLVGMISRSDLLSLYLRPDAEILREIRGVLRDRLWLDPECLQVTVQGGIVTLRGQLDRKSSVPIVGRVVRRTPGVVSVDNQLAFDQDDTWVEFPSDVWIDRPATVRQRIRTGGRTR